MNVNEILKIKLLTVSKNEIVKEMGYNSAKKGLKSLDVFLDEDSDYWLGSSHYDFKYTAHEFFIKLCEVLDLLKEEIEQELHNSELYAKEREIFKDSYIFVNTNFKRTSQPIFALAFSESSRHIGVPVLEMLFKTDAELFEIISNIAKEHFISSNGKAGVWGNIENYHYFQNGIKSYVLDKNGTLIKENVEISMGRATLVIK